MTHSDQMNFSSLMLLLVAMSVGGVANAQVPADPDAAPNLTFITGGFGGSFEEAGTNGGSLTLSADIRHYFGGTHGLAFRFTGGAQPTLGTASVVTNYFDLRYSFRLATSPDLSRFGASLAIDLGAFYGRSYARRDASCTSGGGGWFSTCSHEQSLNSFGGVAALAGNLHMRRFTLGLEGGVRLGTNVSDGWRSINGAVAAPNAPTDIARSLLLSPYFTVRIGIGF